MVYTRDKAESTWKNNVYGLPSERGVPMTCLRELATD